VEREATGNLAIATFRHDTSRAQDPQLHTHAVVLNATRDQQGAWRSLEPRDLSASEGHWRDLSAGTGPWRGPAWLHH
jgi:conjugative relaxase-like TrwC/TraI family protein